MKKIPIKGAIIPNNDQDIYDFFGIEATSPKKVLKLIDEAKGDDLEIEINSGGGNVFAGSEIYTALAGYKGDTYVIITGIAASAASVIAMAGKTVAISPTAQIMLHNVSSSAKGDYRNMQHTAQVLKNANDGIANAYMLKTGLSRAELLGLMEKETWLSAEKALEQKFVDEILFDGENRLIASFGSGMIPQEVINKFLENPGLLQSNAKEIAQAKLNLIKLGGKQYE